MGESRKLFPRKEKLFNLFQEEDKENVISTYGTLLDGTKDQGFLIYLYLMVRLGGAVVRVLFTIVFTFLLLFCTFYLRFVF